MTNSEDILEAAKSLWSGDGTLTALVTGGLTHGRVKQDAGSPYASVRVTMDKPQWNSGTSYIQTATVEFTIWDEAGSANAGNIQVALDAAFQITNRSNLALPNGRSFALMASRKLGDSLTEDPATKAGQSVKVAGGRYELMIQASRS
jgi:hypothetical protein